MRIQINQELYRLQRESQNRYVYFLLAATGACTAFTLNQTNGAALTVFHSPLILALFFWAISFYYGCRHLQKVITHTLLNQMLNDIEMEENKPDEQKRKFMRLVSDSANKFFHRQFRCFIAGAVSYVAWHLLEMALRNPALAAWLKSLL